MLRDTFLDSVADYYFNNRLREQSDWSCYTFVFTSNRAGFYFKNSLKKLVLQSGRGIFGLNVCTIDKLFSQKSRYVLADGLTLEFRLYEVYKEVLLSRGAVQTDDKILTFDFFYTWAQTFLGDFDDVDKYLVDPQKIFENVNDYQALTDDLSHLDEEQREAIRSFWNVVFTQDSEGREHHELFLSLYSCLHDIYYRFKEELEKAGLAYNGMLYRDVATNFAANADDEDAMHYAFIGFNALTSAERVVFKRLVDANLADFFWDYSKDIVQPVIDEKGRAPRMVQVLGNVLLRQPEGYGAGRFVGVYKDEYPAPKDYQQPMSDEEPKINVTSVAYSQSQVSCVCQWLDDLIKSKKSLSESALILGDESMLLPVLQSIPDSIDKINITMGYPLKYTSVYSLIELLFRIKLDSKGNTVRSSLVIPILQHPTMTSILHDDCQLLYRRIVDNKYVYLTLSEVPASLLDYLKVPSSPKDVTGYISKVIGLLKKAIEASDLNIIEVEAVKRLKNHANRFSELMTEVMLNEISDPHLAFNIFMSFIASATIDFEGSKFDGLQVMGMMETRSLDYKNICIISLNEGEFPKASTPITFIPRSLRYSYGLPTQEFRDSIFAYYFFRLIARAKDLNLVYHSNAEDGEQSRFLLQLQYQYNKWDGNEMVGKRPLTLLNSHPIEIPKTKEVVEKLYRRFNGDLIPGTGRYKVLSATAITQYKACSLAFYFSRIVGLQEQDELEEEATAPIIGLIFHEVMETLYNPSRYPHIYTEQDRQELIKNSKYIDDLVDEVYREKMKIRVENGVVPQLHGRNILYNDAIKSYVKTLIKKDAVNIQFQQPEQSYKIKHDIDGRTIYLGGDIDRTHIDEKSRVWIIDYKTGAVNRRDYAGTEDLDRNFANKKVMFQTLLYSHFVYSSRPEYAETPIVPGVIAVRSFSSDGELETAFRNGGEELVLQSSNDPIYVEFKAYLDKQIREIFDPEVPFKSTADTHVCEYCPYSSICAFYMTKENNTADTE